MADTIWASQTVEVAIGPGRPFCVIGERINPAGKPDLFKSLSAMEFSVAEREARRQLAAGAHGLDVNAAVGENAEAGSLRACVAHLGRVLDRPLSIDSADPAALAAALVHAGGRPLVNAVTGSEASMATLLPVAARLGLPVIVSCLDEGGLPENADARIAIARRVIARAREHGIEGPDILVDPLLLPSASFPHGAEVTLKVLRRLGQELGVNTILGASNVSFGSARRSGLNARFLARAIAHGLTAAILDPLQDDVMDVVRSAGPVARV